MNWLLAKAREVKTFAEYLGGVVDFIPSTRARIDSPLWGFWWAFLILIIIAFCGQSTKFIYIDF